MTRRFVLGVVAAACIATVGLLVAVTSGAFGPRQQDASPRTFAEIRWEALIPTDWDPMKRFLASNHGVMDDSDANGQRLMRAIWDHAPTVDAMDGRDVRLSGYVVPLEEAEGGLKEFLLVPYFGACIHTPPPPANQIVEVRVARPVKGVESMDIVSVSGRLTVWRGESSMGTTGYRIDALRVEPDSTRQAASALK